MTPMTRRLLTLLTAALLVGPGLRAQSERPSAAEAVPDAVPQWLASIAVRLDTVEPGAGSADLEGLREIVGDARIVLLGEPTHGNREVYQLKHRIVAFLVQEMGFDVFVLETPLPESFDVDAYISGGVGDPERALAATHVWPWDTEEVAEMLAWMRRHNATSTRPLAFYGFDMQSVERAAAGTLAYLTRVDPAAAEAARAAFGHLAISFSDPEAGGYRPVVDRDYDATVQRAVADVLARFDDHQAAWVTATSADAWSVARQHAQVLQQWVEANRDEGRRYGAVRDSSMAENVRWIREREGPDAKVIVWAHNVHVSNSQTSYPSDGFDRAGRHDWAGRLLRRMFGDEVVIFGFLFNRGGFTALDAAEPRQGPQAFEVGPAPEGTAEAQFSAAGLRLAAVDLRRLPPGGIVSEWFGAPRPTRYSWGDFDPSAPGDYFEDYLLPEAFDALVYVDTTTPSRLVEPANYGAFPILTAPINLDFEHGLVHEPPAGWVAWSKLRRFGFEITTTDERPYHGNRAAMIRRAPGDEIGEASGSVLQRVDAAPYRGRRVRLRAAARSELASDGLAFLRLRVHPSETGDVFDNPILVFDSLDEYRVTSPEWRVFEIEANIPERAETISYGLFLAGSGAAWLDAVTLEAVD